MQWTKKGAHLVLQMRTQVFDERLGDTFRDRYPYFRTKPENEIKRAALAPGFLCSPYWEGPRNHQLAAPQHRVSHALGQPESLGYDIIQRGYGVYRDVAHTTVALCRTFNLPARYVSGYVPDIGYQDPYTP
jgi:hypothetical protein